MSVYDEVPFPASRAWLLDNPLTRLAATWLVRQLPIREGIRVVDIGCGPGRMTLPVARTVGETGEVLAVDMQPQMLERVERRAAKEGLGHVRTQCWTAGEGTLPAGRFDVALLVAVLGEIPADRRSAAIGEIAAALVPGGALVVEEVLIDPHRQSSEAVAALAGPAGLSLEEEERRLIMRQLILRKAAT